MDVRPVTICQQKNNNLNKSMGDWYRETMRWIARVTNSGYMLSVMLECEWDKFVRYNTEIKEYVKCYFF